MLSAPFFTTLMLVKARIHGGVVGAAVWEDKHVYMENYKRGVYYEDLLKDLDKGLTYYVDDVELMKCMRRMGYRVFLEDEEEFWLLDSKLNFLLGCYT